MVLIGLCTYYTEDICASITEFLYSKTLRIPEFFDHEDISDYPQLFVEPWRLMQQIKPTPAAHHICNKPFVFKDLHNYTHVFLRDDIAERPLEQYIYRSSLRCEISERIFAVEVDRKRLNISVERLKPACFIAQQKEHSVNKSITVQSSTEPSLSKKTHSILKTYPSSLQLKTKKTVLKNWDCFKENGFPKIILSIYLMLSIHLLSNVHIFNFELYFIVFLYNVLKSNHFMLDKILRGSILEITSTNYKILDKKPKMTVARPLAHKNSPTESFVFNRPYCVTIKQRESRTYL